MRNSRPTIPAVVIFWICSPIYAYETPKELVDIARSGNRAAIQAIQTIECRFERVPWGNTSTEIAQKYFYMYPCRYWRSGDVYRIFESHEKDDRVDKDYIFQNGKMLILRKGKKEFLPTLTLAIPNPVDGTGGVMWQYLLFSHWGYIVPGFFTLDEILGHRHTVLSIKRISSSNEIHLTISHDGVKSQEFWLDPKINYLVRKSIFIPAADHTTKWEEEVIAYSEPSTGVFVPTTIESRCFKKGELTASIRTIISDLKVNHSLPISAIRLPGITGMECVDLNRGVKYKVNADGHQVGPEKRIEIQQSMPIGSSEGNSISALPMSGQEPSSWWTRLLYFFIAVLLCGIALWLYRKRAADQDD